MCSPSHARRPESACSSGRKKTPVFSLKDACVSTERRLCLYPKDACVLTERRSCLSSNTGVFFKCPSVALSAGSPTWACYLAYLSYIQRFMLIFRRCCFIGLRTATKIGKRNGMRSSPFEKNDMQESYSLLSNVIMQFPYIFLFHFHILFS